MTSGTTAPFSQALRIRRCVGYANYLAYYYGVASNYYNNYTPNPAITYPLVETDVSYSNTLRRTVKQTAVFAEVEYDITDEWTVLGGVRYAEYDRDEYSRFTFPEGLPAGDRGTGDGSFSNAGKSDDTFWKAAVRYNLSDDQMVYWLYSQGVRLGGINSQRAANTGRLPLVYGPDYLDNYELGIKSSWANKTFTFNANLFHMEWSDYQFGADFDEWWLRGTVNAATAESTGVEFQADWQATDRLLLSANGFVADPQYAEDWSNNFVGGVQQPPSPGDLTVQKGMPMPNAPESKFYVSAYYEVPDVFGGNLWFFIDHSLPGPGLDEQLQHRQQQSRWPGAIVVVKQRVDWPAVTERCGSTGPGSRTCSTRRVTRGYRRVKAATPISSMTRAGILAESARASADDLVLCEETFRIRTITE